MFGLLESIAKAAVGVVATPVALVADAVTLGGSLTDRDVPYTASMLQSVVKNLEDAAGAKP